MWPGREEDGIEYMPSGRGGEATEMNLETIDEKREGKGEFTEGKVLKQRNKRKQDKKARVSLPPPLPCPPST